jgi:imidazolonepropionase
VPIDLLVHQLTRLYTCDPSGEGLAGLQDVSVGFNEGKLCYLGPAAQAPSAVSIIDGRGCVGLPGLVDPHTHAVWAGSRSDEFEQRLAGAKYSDILEAGGGILSTVAATRAADERTLTEHCRARLQGMRARGVTTVEIKSGYGLTPEAEAKMLRAARAASDTVRVSTTFLGAHTIPAELRGDRQAYVDQVLGPQLQLCAPLADQIDVYCDRGAFTLEEAVSILAAGKVAGLSIRAHAEQVSHTGIAGAAARLGATAVDHLEQLSPADIETMAQYGCIAVLLPGAQAYLGDPPPPVAAMRKAGVKMAIGTDLNPGSSPLHDLWTAATLACIHQGLTVIEAILGITRHAGLALGRTDLGWLGEGSVADMAVFRPPPGEPPTAASLVQHMGRGGAMAVIRDGQQVV